MKRLMNDAIMLDSIHFEKEKRKNLNLLINEK